MLKKYSMLKVSCPYPGCNKEHDFDPCSVNAVRVCVACGNSLRVPEKSGIGIRYNLMKGRDEPNQQIEQPTKEIAA
jgi:hypothetical protein